MKEITLPWYSRASKKGMTYLAYTMAGTLVVIESMNPLHMRLMYGATSGWMILLGGKKIGWCKDRMEAIHYAHNHVKTLLNKRRRRNDVL
jgi:hypothetical protein